MLTINLVSASAMYDEGMAESHLIQQQEEGDLSNCIDESVCDHFCHISSHLIGLISQAIQNSSVDSRNLYSAISEQVLPYTLSPPSQPPKA
ncbi:MAG: hypothetical protein Q9N32_07150 [Gammaproteobacteria bacterium]|nr:hypothetical protein [Gammaproteobacteria bacterium]